MGLAWLAPLWVGRAPGGGARVGPSVGAGCGTVPRVAPWAWRWALAGVRVRVFACVGLVVPVRGAGWLCV
eukprot:13964776-Alexandrium_andersonii.AAC.1